MKETSWLKICIASVVFSVVIFLIGLFVVYVIDDRWSPAADEASVPSPTTR